MGNLIGICGNSGSGKTSGVRTLNHEETFVVSVTNKRLPFRGSSKKYTPLTKGADGKYTGNYYASKSVSNILSIFKIVDKTMPHIRTIVIDDANYIMSCETMDSIDEKGFDKFSRTAKNYYSLLTSVQSLRDDLNVVVISHIENTGDTMNPQYKMKTTGKMLDTVVNVDGLFTYVLYSELRENSETGFCDYVYRTRTIDGSDTCKTPLDCFKDTYIPNDLELVISTIEEYNNDL